MFSRCACARSDVSGGLPAVPEPLVPPLKDVPFLIGLIAEITGRPIDEVTRRLRHEQEEPGDVVAEEIRRWGIEPHVWSERLVEFYRQTDAFLYETLVWNFAEEKNAMRRWIGEFFARRLGRPGKILTYGDGLGFDSVYLALAGHEVWYFEVSAECRRFAQAIVKSCQTSVKMVTAPDEIQPASFDAVLCLDVLEHVPDPSGLVQQLSAMLRPGGWLVAHAPFFYISPRTPTHLRANRRFSGKLASLYTPHGLRLIDGRPFWNPIVLEKCQSPCRSVRWTYRTALLRVSGVLLSLGQYQRAPHARLIDRVRCRRSQLPSA